MASSRRLPAAPHPIATRSIVWPDDPT